MTDEYVIRFDFPEGIVFAGLHKGAAGWAPTVETAMKFDSPEAAGRTLANSYGPSVEYGYVMRLDSADV